MSSTPDLVTLSELGCGELRLAPPRPGLERPPRKEGDLATPFMFEALTGGVLGFGLGLGGLAFLFSPVGLGLALFEGAIVKRVTMGVEAH